MTQKNADQDEDEEFFKTLLSVLSAFFRVICGSYFFPAHAAARIGAAGGR